MDDIREIQFQQARQRSIAGQEAIQRGDVAQAIIEYSKAIFFAPDYAEFYLLRADAYVSYCDLRSAILNMKQVLRFDPAHRQARNKLCYLHYILGQQCLDQGQFEDAIAQFDEGLVYSKTAVPLLVRKAIAFLLLAKLDDAKAELEKCQVIDPTNADVHILKSYIATRSGDMFAALTEAANLLRARPDADIARKAMAAIQAKMQEITTAATLEMLSGDSQSAIERLNKAIELLPDDASLYIQRGSAYRLAGDLQSALRDFQQACEMTGNDPTSDASKLLAATYNDLGMRLFDGEQYAEAIVMFNRAVVNSKDAASYYLNRGDAYKKLLQTQLAMADFHQALEVDTNNWDAKVRLSLLHYEAGLEVYNIGQWAQAEYEQTRAIGYNPKVAEYYISRAHAFIHQGKYTEANKDVTQALKLDPDHIAGQQLYQQLNPGTPWPPPPDPEEEAKERERRRVEQLQRELQRKHETPVERAKRMGIPPPPPKNKLDQVIRDLFTRKNDVIPKKYF
eukprot:TRINITY_DN9364_c0_g1_i2.p1 TRINITY_DN9364_c0_g1~~TRINITY_DN9364_c0_g1_i2.p1  ORF type:complete len:521 (-),score=124.17 TRINITY_DN9364_c0_g1_i2:651-2174(-)